MYPTVCSQCEPDVDPQKQFLRARMLLDWCRNYSPSFCVAWALLLLFVILALTAIAAILLYLALLDLYFDARARATFLRHARAILCCRPGPPPDTPPERVIYSRETYV